MWADEDVRVARLAGRGMAEDEARRRMKIQMSMEEYQNLGTELILNNGTVAELEETLDALIRRELIGRGIPLKTGLIYAKEEPRTEPELLADSEASLASLDESSDVETE